MRLLKILIQAITIYRAVAIFMFIMFYAILPNQINSVLLITAVTSDFLDGYLAKKYKLTSMGGKLLDLFSDKYLNCISIIFLIIQGYALLPLLMILTKEIFVLSFRSVAIDGKFIISTNRNIGGIMTATLWFTVFFHINSIFISAINVIVMILGISNFIYLIYKIVSNFSNIKIVFKDEV